jgi:hypothetical protein
VPPLSTDSQSVFLNVPFDRRYAPLFTALVSSLTALGRKPHCVLEVPSSGRNRLDRILELIASCGASVHDLSRVSLSHSPRVPRFNMPFELGMTWVLARLSDRGHSLFVLEERSYRLQASLSDLNGHDPHIHNGTQTGILRCMLDCFGAPEGQPPLATLRKLARRLTLSAKQLMREQGITEPFHPHLFRQIVDVASELARVEGEIPRLPAGTPSP